MASEDQTRALTISFRPHATAWQLPDWFVRELNLEFGEICASYLPNYQGLDEAIQESEIFVGLSLRSDQAARAKKLRWVHSLYAAVNHLLVPEIIQGSVVVTSASAVHRIPVAEHALALILGMARWLPESLRMQQRRHWGQSDIWSGRPFRKEVNGATLGIFGMGGIGIELAKRAKAVGMHVIGLRRRAGAAVENVDEMLEVDDLPVLLPRCDYIVLALPDTAQTRHMIGAEQLRLMKKDAYLINVGRGTAIDEAALVDALQRGVSAGAALDVMEKEPPPPESALWDAPNLLLTPHIGSATSPEYLWRRQYQVLAENLRRYLKGEPLLYVVDKMRGY
ncbi:MAG TPA: D-2-hydroxyacid dehydrogenase [Acidobacteriota bacterium]|jgi:phosphoglycerate dehydrogenase-like enzyme|nr:D-2-hydroxyacid dehydrogenase [Acidobacteriota bacterium]